MKFSFAVWQRSPRNKLSFICETHQLAVEYVQKKQEKYPEDVTWVQYPTGVRWIVVRNSPAFFLELIQNDVEFVSFDHDIQEFYEEGETTGYSVLKEMVDIYLNSGVKLPQCFFHTQNPVGKKNMQAYYDCAVKHREILK